jgi:MFS family permease
MPSTSPDRERPSGSFLGLTPLVSTRAVVCLCVAIFLFWMSLYVFVPILSVYTEELGASLSMVGIVAASYAIAQIVLRIPIGIWADLLGKRKPFIIAGFIAAAAGALLLGLAPSPWVLFAGRTVTGVSGATYVALSVFFAAYFPRNQTAQAMGIVTALNGAGQVIASLAGGYTAEVWGSQMTFFVGVGLAVVGLPLLLFIPEVRVEPHPFSYKTFVKMPSFRLLILVSAICIIGQFVVQGTSLGFVPLHGDRIGASRAELGHMLTVTFGASVVGSLLVLYIVNRLGYSVTLLLSFVVMAAAFAWVPFIQSVPLLIASQGLVGLGRGIFFPVLMALSIQGVSSSERATAMGVFQSLYAIGMLVGPLTLGFLADGMGLDSVFYLSVVLCILGGMLSFAPGILRLRAQPPGS